MRFPIRYSPWRCRVCSVAHLKKLTYFEVCRSGSVVHRSIVPPQTTTPHCCSTCQTALRSSLLHGHVLYTYVGFPTKQFPGPLLRCLTSPLGERLRHLFLAGNPVCLLPAYRQRILSGGCGPGLLVLDDLPVSASERGLAAPAAPATNAAVTNGGEGWKSDGPLGAIHFGVKVCMEKRDPLVDVTHGTGLAVLMGGAVSGSVRRCPPADGVVACPLSSPEQSSLEIG